MGEGTKIEWATHTFNPWIGCTRISPACDHCYAADWDKRYHGGEHWGAGAPRRRTSAANWRQPYKWARHARETGERPRVFCASLADVFDNEVPQEWRHDLWRVIRDTPDLDWLLLTKRIGNVPNMLPEDWDDGMGWGNGWPNVWIGITVVTQVEADRDIPKLLYVPAAVRFLSIEPMIEEIDLYRGGFSFLHNTRSPQGKRYGKVDWVIAGGESGPNARPMHPDQVRSLRDQCAAAGVPFLFKQWGEWSASRAEGDFNCRMVWPADGIGRGGVIMARVGKKAAGRLLDGREHNEVPQGVLVVTPEPDYLPMPSFLRSGQD